MYPFLKNYKVEQQTFKGISYHNFIFFAVLLVITYIVGDMLLTPLGQLVTLGMSFVIGLYLCGKSQKNVKRTRLESCVIFIRYAIGNKFIQGGRRCRHNQQYKK